MPIAYVIFIFIMKSYSKGTRKNKKKFKKITWWTNMKLKTVRHAQNTA